VLDSGSNRLSGSIPAFIGNLKYLVDLDLAFNALTGQIPSSLAAIVSSAGPQGTELFVPVVAYL
jgi:hypothetical protein